MRKTLTVAFVLISIGLFGQNQTIGFQCGLNLSNISANEPWDNTNYRKSVITGIDYELSFFEKYRLGVGLLYSQQGFSEKITYTNGLGDLLEEEKTKFNYNYLLIPIKFGYAFGDVLKVTPKVGISPSLLLNAKVISPAFDENGLTGGTEETDIKENINKFDLSGQFEIEVSHPLMQNFEITYSVLYRRSITEFSNEDFFENSHMKHYGFSFSVGFKYTIN